MAGTPKGEGILFNLAQQPEFTEFHYSSYDNPSLDKDELNALVNEYKAMGEDYFKQEIMADYVMPVGLVYREWSDENYRPIEYDESLPLYISMDFGINDPTSIIWIQRQGSEYRIIDAYEAANADIRHFGDVIKSKPYKPAEFITGDPAGRARTLTTGTSPIDELAKMGIFVLTYEGNLTLPPRIRSAHMMIPNLFVTSSNEGGEYVRRCLRNYRYPEKRGGINVGHNENPIHNWASHICSAIEFYAVWINPTWSDAVETPKSFDERLKDEFWELAKSGIDQTKKSAEYQEYENYQAWSRDE